MLSIVVMWTLCGSALAQTFVSGRIDTDTVWTITGNPYVLADDVEIAGGATLTIEARVQVVAGAGTRLIVGGENAGDTGTLQALGLRGLGISFDSQVRGEPWGGILFRETAVEPVFGPDGEFVSGSILRSCRIERAEEPLVMRGAVAYLTSTTIIGPTIPLGSGVRVELRDAPTLKSFRADGLEVDGARSFGLLVDGGTGHQLADCSFRNNGQGVSIVSTARGDSLETVRFERCTFSGNGVDGSPFSRGGGLAIFTRADAEIVDCVFRSNEAGGDGGAIWGGASPLIVTRCEFDSNRSGSAGGAIHDAAEGMTIDGCAFVANSAMRSGGAVHSVSGSLRELLVTRSRFECNESPIGGAMLVRQRLPRIEQSEFVSNASTIDGGAIRFLSCNPVTLDSNRFLDNSTGGSGGAISFDGIGARDGVDIVGNTFAGNIARLGGAVYTTDAS
ncbi:MAG: right-handed parallel beta-helix repeat-containing protein, partial [Planctomycetota bacterium]